ncbi:MAG: cupin domain-containing protein [Deltaproteobacteria bacterium]|nr:cupin domain-containing protein [Deltaproteobacteria bacterium]
MSAETKDAPLHGRLDKSAGDEPAPGVSRIKLTTSEGGLARIEIQAGASIKKHSHKAEELLIVEKGRLHVGLNFDEYILGPGEYLVISPGSPHDLKAIGKRVASVLVIHMGYLGRTIARRQRDVI